MAILYLESFGNPRKFARTARRVGIRMPVITVLGGRSAAGQPAAQSHTAAATPLVTREALFAQAGIVATASLGELIGTAAFLSCQPCSECQRVAVVSNACGAGVLAADTCGDRGLLLAPLAADDKQPERRFSQRRAHGPLARPVERRPHRHQQDHRR